MIRFTLCLYLACLATFGQVSAEIQDHIAKRVRGYFQRSQKLGKMGPKDQLGTVNFISGETSRRRGGIS